MVWQGRRQVSMFGDAFSHSHSLLFFIANTNNVKLSLLGHVKKITCLSSEKKFLMGREVIFYFYFLSSKRAGFPILASTTAVRYSSGIAFPPSKTPELKSPKT